MSESFSERVTATGRTSDILYLHPSKLPADFTGYVEAKSASPYMLLPVGVPGMINLLCEQGFRVTGLNVPMETMLDHRFDLAVWLGEQRGVRLVAIDLHWYEHAFGALDVARICKQVYPDIPVVLGGLTASFFADQILKEFPQVDYVIRGDGERPLLDLARHVCGEHVPGLAAIPNLTYRRDGQIVENELSYCAASADLDSLDFVDLDFLIHAEQYHAVEFSLSSRVAMTGAASRKGHWLTIGRGCHFDCSFCGGGKASHLKLAGRNGIVPRTPGRVVDDLARLQQQGFQQVSFNLDPAIMGKTYWSELFTGMRQRGVKIGIYNEFFQLPSRVFIDAFIEAADLAYSELAFTPLSGSDKVRRKNGKHFTNQQLLETLAVLGAHEIPIFLYFSINLPGESRKAFRQTLQLAEQVCQAYPSQILQMINMCHTVDPCCPMSRQPQRYRLELEFRNFKDYYAYCRATPVLRSNVSVGDWRGYKAINSKGPALDRLARQWDAFCAGQKARCYPVPRTW